MTVTAAIVDDLLSNLEEEDYRTVISFIQYLSDKRKKEKGQENRKILSEIQSVFQDDKGWDSEEEMIADMAAFRRERMNL